MSFGSRFAVNRAISRGRGKVLRTVEACTSCGARAGSRTCSGSRHGCQGRGTLAMKPLPKVGSGIKRNGPAGLGSAALDWLRSLPGWFAKVGNPALANFNHRATPRAAAPRTPCASHACSHPSDRPTGIGPMAVFSDKWPMMRATGPTVISDSDRKRTGHRWAKLGPQMGHKAKRRPWGRRLPIRLVVVLVRESVVARAGFEPATFGL